MGQPSAQSTWAVVGSLMRTAFRGMYAEGKTGGGWGERPLLRSRELELFLFCEMTVANMIRSLCSL